MVCRWLLDMTQDFVAWFREASPYINAHRKRTFIVFLDSEACVDRLLSGIVHDLALLVSLGVRLVVVMDARTHVDRELAVRGIESRLFLGQRITTPEVLEAAVAAIGRLRAQLEARLSMSLPDTPMHNTRVQVASGNYVTGKPLGVIEGVDYQLSGEVRRINSQLLRHHLDDNSVVLLTSLGHSITGETFYIPGERVASAVAATLCADKLIMLTAEPVITRDGQTVSAMRPSELAAHASDLAPHGIAAHYIHALLEASRAGVPRCHLVDHRIDGALLLELFTRQGIGTQVSEYRGDVIRQAGAGDIGGILRLIEPLEQLGVLVRRDRERLEREIGHFQVADLDGLVVGCAALYPLQDKLAELACLAVEPHHKGHGYGEALLRAIEVQARARGFRQLLVLTTRAEHWFTEHGFRLISFAGLPDARRRMYNYQRNSKILRKDLHEERHEKPS